MISVTKDLTELSNKDLVDTIKGLYRLASDNDPLLQEMFGDLSTDMYREELFNRLLQTCKSYGIKYVSVNRCELLGDGSSYARWPAIWRVTKDLCIYGGCGNDNQAQMELFMCKGIYTMILPKRTRGFKWDTETGNKICEAEYLFEEHR